jgi:hypothetical protein
VVPNGCDDEFHRTIDDALATFPRAAFDYVWLINSPAYDRRLTKGLSLESHAGGAELYRVERPAVP